MGSMSAKKRNQHNKNNSHDSYRLTGLIHHIIIDLGSPFRRKDPGGRDLHQCITDGNQVQDIRV